MKICFVSEGYLNDSSTAVNGMQVQCHALAKAFSQRAHKVSYIAETRGVVRGPIQDNRVCVYYVPPRKYIFSFVLTFFRMFNLLQLVSPDICYLRGRSLHLGVSAIYCRMFECRLIWGSNGHDGCQPNKHIRNLAGLDLARPVKLLLWPERYIFDCLAHFGIRNAYKVVVQNEHQGRELAANFNRQGVVIRSGIQIPDTFRKAASRKVRKILWLGRTDTNKRPDLFAALAVHMSAVRDVTFIMAGPGNTPNSDFQVDRLPTENIEYIGAIDAERAMSEYEDAYLLVNTSESEGFPNTFVEAWAHGVPVVSINVDPDDLIKTHGLGLHSGTFERMLADVGQLLHDTVLREKLSVQARRFAERHLNIESVIKKYEELLSN